jgi:hypothetical protein
MKTNISLEETQQECPCFSTSAQDTLFILVAIPSTPTRIEKSLAAETLTRCGRE